MKQIRRLRDKYFQKSRTFLYPALGMKRGISVTPIETYIAWQEHPEFEDARLICLYHLRNDQDYRSFQMNIINNPLFERAIEVEDNKIVYIFNMSSMQQDWDNFVQGKYSKLSKQLKTKIEDFFKGNPDNYIYVQSWLYPERYFRLYADLLSSQEDEVPKMMRALKEVGELCSPPDLEKEKLVIRIKSLEVTSTMS